MKIKLAILFFQIIVLRSFAQQDIYANTVTPTKNHPKYWHDMPKKFVLSKQYPKEIDEKEKFSWDDERASFIKNPKDGTLGIALAKKVLDSFLTLENINDDFRFGEKANPLWYHAPAMALDNQKGREFIHGLTSERNSHPKELHPYQKSKVQNWAVGFYNKRGAYEIGRVWANPINPLKKANFTPNTVSIKLLFTEANTAIVPYLKNAPTWYAHILPKVEAYTKPRVEDTLHLIQVDVALKYDATHWLFSTFVYHHSFGAQSPWHRLICAGVATNAGLNWINPNYTALFKKEFGNSNGMHLGAGGQLNGPVDNPKSSCIGCHLKAGNPHDSGTMDYSLQLDYGIDDLLGIQPQKKYQLFSQTTPKSTSNDTKFTQWTLMSLIGISLVLATLVFKK